MVELIPGMGENVLAGGILKTVNVLGLAIAVVVIIAVIFGLFYLLKKVLKYNTNVLLEFEVGDNITEKADMAFIDKNNSKIKFRKNRNLIAIEPPDALAFYKDFHFLKKNKKTFRGFVRNGQVTWCYPHPVTGRIKLAYNPPKYVENKEGKMAELVQDVPSFRVLPADLAQVTQAEIRRNFESTHKVKWWQNPMVMGTIVAGMLVLSMLFLFLVNKSTVELAKESIRMAASNIDKLSGQVVS